jgi:hypothetical protein
VNGIKERKKNNRESILSLKTKVFLLSFSFNFGTVNTSSVVLGEGPEKMKFPRRPPKLSVVLNCHCCQVLARFVRQSHHKIPQFGKKFSIFLAFHSYVIKSCFGKQELVLYALFPLNKVVV